MGIDEVVSEVKEIFNRHPFAVSKGGADPGREARKPHFLQRISGAGVVVAIGR